MSKRSPGARIGCFRAFLVTNNITERVKRSPHKGQVDAASSGKAWCTGYTTCKDKQRVTSWLYFLGVYCKGVMQERIGIYLLDST